MLSQSLYPEAIRIIFALEQQWLCNCREDISLNYITIQSLKACFFRASSIHLYPTKVNSYTCYFCVPPLSSHFEMLDVTDLYH